jgi:hypothetical protein
MKKQVALLPVLFLFFACASATDVIDQRALGCGPGQDIEVRAGLAPPEIANTIGQMVFLVEVANNSHEDLTVDSIVIDPTRTPPGQRPLQRTAKDVDQLIAEGTEHVFELPTAYQAMYESLDPRSAGQGRHEFSVTVKLTNGDSYRCPFAADVR